MTTFLSSPDERAGFSSGVDVGDLVYADASALDPATRRRVEGLETIAQETTVAIDRLAATLAQAGLTLADVVKVNCYLTDDSQRAEFWRTFDAAFAPGPYPVRVTQVGGLIGDLRVLLDAVAAR